MEFVRPLDEIRHFRTVKVPGETSCLQVREDQEGDQ